MEKIKTLIFIIFATTMMNAQNYKFGKISKEDLSETQYSIDSTAKSVVLYKKRNTYYRETTNGLMKTDEFHYRIKIYKSSDSRWASKKIYLYKNGSARESLSGLKAYTYNLVDGEIVKTKLSKKELFKDKESKNLNYTSFTMPKVADNCIIEYKYSIVSPFYSSMTDMKMQYSIPVKKYEGEVKMYKYLYYNKTQKGYITLKIEQTDSYNPSSFKVNAENIPAMKSEGYVDNITNYRTGIVFELASITIPGQVYESFASTWNDACKRIYKSNAFGVELKKRNPLKDETLIIKNSEKTDKQKIHDALELVKSKKKWNGSGGIYAYKGSRKALKEKIAATGDMNILLIKVLKDLGYTAYPVLVSTRSNGIKLFPTIDGFNYMIVAVKLGDKYEYVDAASEYGSMNIMENKVLNWKGRIILDKDKSDWIDLNQIADIAKKTHNIMASIDEFGATIGKIRIVRTKAEALSFRNYYNKDSEDELIENIDNKYKRIEVSDLKLKNKEEILKPISQSFEFESEELMDSSIPGKIFFKPLLFLSSDMKNPFKMNKRLYPVNYTNPFEYNYNIMLTIPEGYKVASMPDAVNMALPKSYGGFKIITASNGNKITIKSSFSIKTSVISAMDYESLKQFYTQMEAKLNENIVLEKS